MPQIDQADIPLVAGFHHASVLVSDLSRSLVFYCELLGLPLDTARPDLGYPGAWLNVENLQIHLLVLPNPDPVTERPAHAGRDRHLAFTVVDLDALQARLAEAGVAYTRSASGRRALFCRDPDGNGLEFIAAGR